MPSLFGGRKKAYVFNGTAAPSTKSCWSQANEADTTAHTGYAKASPRLSLAFGFGEEPPQPPSLPRIPKPPKIPPPSLHQPYSTAQLLEQKSESTRKNKRPSSASRATEAVSAAWTAARAALKGQKMTQAQIDADFDIDTRPPCFQASCETGTCVGGGSRKDDVKFHKTCGVAAKEEGVSDEESELKALKKKLVAAVYDNYLAEGDVETVLQTCPEVGWLAQCAQNAPPPVGWQRCGWLPGSDGDLVVCYANTSTDEVMEASPLLESFAKLAKLAVHAIVNPHGAGNAARWVLSARDEALQDAAKAQEGWSGPHVDETSGAEFFYCTATGCSSWTSPAASHAYIAHVAQQLLQSHIFPEQINDQAFDERQETSDAIERKREGSRPSRVDTHNGYSGDYGASRGQGIAPRKHKHSHEHRSSKSRPSTVGGKGSPGRKSSKGSVSGDFDVTNNTAHSHTGYVEDSGGSRNDDIACRQYKHSYENRSRKLRPSPVQSTVSESIDSDVTSNSNVTVLPMSSSRQRKMKPCSNAMFFEIHSDDSAVDLDADDSLLHESSRLERAPRRQKQKRRSSSGTTDSSSHNNGDTNNSKAACELARAAAALSAAAVALAGLSENGNKEAVHVDSLLAAASALRVAGSEQPPTCVPTAEVTKKRRSKSESRSQQAIPRLALEKLANSPLEADFPNGDAETGRYNLASTSALDDTSENEQQNTPCYSIPGFPFNANEIAQRSSEPKAIPLATDGSHNSVNGVPKSMPSVLAPLPPEVRNIANTSSQGTFIDAKTLLEYAEQAAAGDTPTSSTTSSTVLNAEKKEAIHVAESALKAAFDHISVSSRRPSRCEVMQQPDFESGSQPMAEQHVGTQICKHEDEESCNNQDSTVSRRRVSVGGA